jgi:hypothetical protein
VRWRPPFHPLRQLLTDQWRLVQHDILQQRALAVDDEPGEAAGDQAEFESERGLHSWWFGGRVDDACNGTVSNFTSGMAVTAASGHSCLDRRTVASSSRRLSG